MDQLSILAVLACFGIVLAALSAFKLGRMSRRKEDRHDAIVNSLMNSSNLDEPRYHVELGPRKEPAASEGWKKMPRRDAHGRFLKKVE